MRTRSAVMGAFVATALAAASMGACGGTEVGQSGRPSGRSFGMETWHEASFGSSPTEVVVRFDGPDGPEAGECEPDREVVVEADETEVRLVVRRYSPSPVITCERTAQTITATLPAPLGDRPLTNPKTGWRFRDEGGRLVLDPDSTPCARADCSAPAVAKASCNPFEYGVVVNEQLRPSDRPDEDVRCDGTFLVLTRDGRRAWFVNRLASWKLLTADLISCGAIWDEHRIRFPAQFCD